MIEPAAVRVTVPGEVTEPAGPKLMFPPVASVRLAALLELTEGRRQNEANERLAAHLYHHGEQWLQFLEDPSIPATNHRGEQALKTPIVNRKVWGGNRTEAGAAAQAVVGSILQTCQKKTIDAFAYISDALRGVLGNLFPSPAG